MSRPDASLSVLWIRQNSKGSKDKFGGKPRPCCSCTPAGGVAGDTDNTSNWTQLEKGIHGGWDFQVRGELSRAWEPKFHSIKKKEMMTWFQHDSNSLRRTKRQDPVTDVYRRLSGAAVSLVFFFGRLSLTSGDARWESRTPRASALSALSSLSALSALCTACGCHIHFDHSIDRSLRYEEEASRWSSLFTCHHSPGGRQEKVLAIGIPSWCWSCLKLIPAMSIFTIHRRCDMKLLEMADLQRFAASLCPQGGQSAKAELVFSPQKCVPKVGAIGAESVSATRGICQYIRLVWFCNLQKNTVALTLCR